MIACPNCQTIQPAGMINTGRLTHCPVCRTLLSANVFPAFFRPLQADRLGTSVQEQGQAECFNHPGKEAVVPCSACGRLLCALCEVRIDNRSLCMSCLSADRERPRIVNIQNQRTLYDSLALWLAFWPMLTIFFTIITAPATLFVVWRYRHAPGSILPRTRYRFWLAGLLAILQIVGWFIVLIQWLR